MNDRLPASPSESPKPSAEDVCRLLAGELDRPSRPGHVALLVAASTMATVCGLMLATEVALPARTRVAFGVMIGIALSWVCFSVWTLTRRGVLLGKHRVVAAWMAVAFTSVFTSGALAIGWWSPRRGAWTPAVGLGAVLVVAAASLLVRARRRVAELTRRRAELERRLARSTASLCAGLLLLSFGRGVGEAQQPNTSGRLETKPATFVVSGQAIPVTEGRLTVPANRATAGGATLVLTFVRISSTASLPRAPIVFLAGGPGDAGTRAVQGMPRELLDQLLAVADVIAFDQRGTGRSQPTNPACPPGAMVPTDRVADPVAMLAVLRTRVESCLADAKRDGIDVLGLTTTESADDLEDLRRALGVPRLSFLAGSYGTHLALATARRYPASVERMVLAGVEGLDDTFKLPSRVDSVLATIAQRKRPSLLHDIRALRARLAARPGTFTFPTGQTIVLGEWDLQRWISESLDAVPKINAMLAGIAAMRDSNDLRALGRWALGYRVSRPLNLMNLAMDCASYASASRLARIRREAPTGLVGDAINFPLPNLCDAPSLPRLPEAYRDGWTADVPALLISGTFDGRTPVQNSEDAAHHLPRARSLVVDGASHALFREPEVTSALLAFFRE